jgi:hypothetical protein
MNRPLPRLLLLVLSVVLFASWASARPGIDLSVNHICPGVSGASGLQALDCVALAQAGRFVSIYATFLPAENISDLTSLDGQIQLSMTSKVTEEGAFWNPSSGGCLDQHGGAMLLVATKPTNGDACGTDTAIRPAFAHSAYVAVVSGDYLIDIYFTVYDDAPFAALSSQRLFGFDMRFDPAMASENGGPCGSCCQAWVCNPYDCNAGVEFQVAEVTPRSASDAPTTPLHDGTGIPGVGSLATFVNGCSPVPTRGATWGTLKSLYR